MLHTPTKSLKSSHVIVRFGDGVHSFLLRDGATLTELADCIEDLGAQHDGAPLSIDVEFTLPRSGLSAQPRQVLTH